MTYYILNQGSFVRGRATPSDITYCLKVYIDKIIWYNSKDDDAYHLSKNNGRTANKIYNGRWYAFPYAVREFPDDDAAKLWWELEGKSEREV